MKPWIDRLNRLSPVERRTLAVGALAAGMLLMALAWTCQQSVERGERLRAEMRGAVAGGLLR
jgi:hypothetical protein